MSYLIKIGKALKPEQGLALLDLEKTIHSYIIGASRSGKTNFMIGYAGAVVKHLDCAMIIIDPHGTFAPQIATIAPKDRLIYVDKDHPIVINPLRREYLNKSDKVKEITSVINSSVKVLNPQQADITVKMEKIIRRAIYMFDEAELSLDYLSDFLEDWLTRDKFFKSHDKTKFWNLFDSTQKIEQRDRDENRATAGRITDRLSLLYEDENISKFFIGDDQFNLFDITKEKKIICFNLDGYYDEDLAYIGNLITYAVRSYVTKAPINGPRLLVFIDEFHYFVNKSFNNTLTSCLKRNISFCMSHHDHSQIDDGLVNIAINNARLIASFEIGDKEEKKLLKKYKGYKEGNLLDWKFKCCHLGIDGKPHYIKLDHYDIEAYEPPPVDESISTEIPRPPEQRSYLLDGWIEI